MKTDEELYKDVTDRFRSERNLNSSKIIVGVKNNIVTLTGTVGTFSDKCKAVRILANLNGVSAVVDNLGLKFMGSPEFSHNEIVKAGLNALKWRVFIPCYDIPRIVKNGDIALTSSNI